MELRRIYDYRSPHCQPHCTAASDPGYRSLRAFLLVERQGAMDHLRKPWPHETHARERSRNRRERSDVPHSARPMSLFRIGQSQAEGPIGNSTTFRSSPEMPWPAAFLVTVFRGRMRPSSSRMRSAMTWTRPTFFTAASRTDASLMAIRSME